MCKVQMLRALVEQRLTAAAEEIFGLFERTIAEYEEELSRSKEENERQRKLLEAVFTPQLRLHRADVQQLCEVKEEVPPQEEPEPPHIKEEQEELWSSQEGEQLQGLEEADITKFPFTPVPVKSEDDEEKPQSSQGEDCGGPGPHRNPDPDVQQLCEVKEEVPPQEEPEPPHIKEEQEELWTSQEGEQLQGLEEADITKFPFTPVPVKSEDDEEEPQSSQGEDCGGPGPHRNPDPGRHPEPETDDETGDSSEPETDDSEDWKETREPQSGLKSLDNHEAPAGEKPFSCSECGKRFGKKGSLRNHMRSHTGEKPYGCSVCGERFLRKADLKRHVVTHTGEKEFTQLHQTETREAEPPASSSTQHMETEPEPDRNPDPDTHPEPDPVDKTGDSSEPETDDSEDWKETREPQSGLKSRDNDEAPVSVKPFSCSDCGRRFWTKALLRNHVRSHTGERPFSCSVCKKSFARKGNLQPHMRLHTGEKPYSCSACNRRFTYTNQLRNHHCFGYYLSLIRQTETREAEPPASSSTQHMETGPEPKTDHSEDLKETREPQSGLNSLDNDEVPAAEKPFSCSECGKGFGTKGYLKRHMLIHTGEKPYSCSVCNKSFTQSAHLQKHMRLHNGEETFPCSVCGETFSRRLHLTKHMRSHPGEDPFTCSICNKSFKSLARARVHKRTHIKEKSYSCWICRKTLNDSGHLEKHMRIHTGLEAASSQQLY